MNSLPTYCTCQQHKTVCQNYCRLADTKLCKCKYKKHYKLNIIMFVCLFVRDFEPSGKLHTDKCLVLSNVKPISILGTGNYDYLLLALK